MTIHLTPSSRKDINFPKHTCLLYRRPADRIESTKAFVREGLALEERILWVTADIPDPLSPEGVQEAFGAPIREGQLVVLPPESFVLREGRFRPRAVMAFIREEGKKALENGWNGLRIICDMSWAIQGFAGSEHLIEYEIHLGELLQARGLRILCQYELTRFPPALLLYVITAHPHIAFKGRIAHNPFYLVLPPSMLEMPPKTTLELWLAKLAESEEARVF